MGYTAAEAAYRHGQPWLDSLLGFFRSQRQLLVDYIEDCLPTLAVTVPEATYLAWLDFNNSGVPADDLARFLLEDAKVGLNIGAEFGTGGEGFARINFACTPALLTEALDRVRTALERRAV
jgi:cystathionine beta-lyase